MLIFVVWAIPQAIHSLQYLHVVVEDCCQSLCHAATQEVEATCFQHQIVWIEERNISAGSLGPTVTSTGTLSCELD